MHHFDAHELANSWELRAGLLDEDPADASISACLRECAAALRNIAAPSPAPAPSAARLTQDGKLHVTAWQCHGCGHRGIDDGDDAAEACSDCNWRGPCPDEDVCPGCGREGTMVSACPKCGDRYYIKAEADIVIPAASQAPAVVDGSHVEMLRLALAKLVCEPGSPEYRDQARTALATTMSVSALKPPVQHKEGA